MKNIVLIRAFIILSFISFAAGCSGSKYQVSDHYDGSSFYYNESSDHSFWQALKWWWEMDTVDWPEWIEDAQQPAPPEFVKGNIRVTYINHATTLIQLDSMNILTDPIWSDYAGPVSWLASKRIRAPGVKLENLPVINYILISHDHYDHLDLPTLKMLSEKFSPVILTGLGIKPLLESEGIKNVYELDWWNEYSLKNGTGKIIFVPARHRSGRSLFDGNSTLFGGFVIESPSGKIYFAGDTAFGEFIFSLRNKFGSIDMAILPIGNYEKRWFMKNQHMNPDDAVRAHILLNAKHSIGIHYATFKEHPEQEINAHEKDLAAAIKKYNLPDSAFSILKFGEGIWIK